MRQFLLASERLLTQTPWPVVVGVIALIVAMAPGSVRQQARADDDSVAGMLADRFGVSWMVNCESEKQP